MFTLRAGAGSRTALIYADVAWFLAGQSRAERVNLARRPDLVLGLLTGLPRPHRPPSIFPASMLPVPAVTTGSSAANVCYSSSSPTPTTPRPHEPVPPSMGPKITI